MKAKDVLSMYTNVTSRFMNHGFKGLGIAPMPNSREWESRKQMTHCNNLKASFRSLRKLERQYPGILKQIRRFESKPTPPCPECSSSNTAHCISGAIGRTIALAAASHKIRLYKNNKMSFCRDCDLFFPI